MLRKIVGWTFVFLCPMVGGIPLLCMGSEGLALLEHDTAMSTMAWSSVAWILLYVTWFDGSKTQDCLM